MTGCVPDGPRFTISSRVGTIVVFLTRGMLRERSHGIPLPVLFLPSWRFAKHVYKLVISEDLEASFSAVIFQIIHCLRCSESAIVT